MLVTFEELPEHLALEGLDELQLAAPLQLEPLELGHRAVEVVDHVLLLEQLALLGRGRQRHGLVRPVQLEEDGALGPRAVLTVGLGLLQVLVLVVCVSVVHV